MIDPSPTPSRQLRILAYVARWLLGLILAFWLLLAVAWGALHGFIVPRIGEWRVDVERLATHALGAPVRIDGIAAKADRFFPSFHLSGVRFFDPQGREALKLHSVDATVSARSLLRLGLEQLSIQAPELDVRHLHDGRWQVAGLDLVQSDSTESPALDWLLELPELVIHNGSVQFTDEQRGMETVQWRDVDVLLRNRRWSHVLRIEATPVTEGGERMQLVGAFRESLLPSAQAPWTHWSGQWYASLHLQQVPALPWPQAWGVKAIQGEGLARVWVDVQRGKPIGVTADVALAQAQVSWRDAQVADLQLQQVKGRFEGRWQAQGARWSGQNFSFSYADGKLWPSSQWAVSTTGPLANPTRTHIALDYADLAMANQVVQTLPVPEAIRQPLARWAPQGALRQLELEWQASGGYQARGQVTQLVLQSQPAEDAVGVPGVNGLNAVFEFHDGGGKAALDMQAGALHVPGVFEEAEVPLQSLQAQLQWSSHNGRLKVEVPHASFSNEDAQGTLHGFWQMGEQAEDRLPGYLQLQGVLDRANGARVYRYLPLEVPEEARHYVRDSVKQGQGHKVEFEVQGNLQDMPFERPDTGRFFIKAPVDGVVYEFAPAALLQEGSQPWPALTNLRGTLVFDGAAMRVQQAETGFAGHPKLRMHSVNAQIPDLFAPHLVVQAVGNTDLGAALGFMQGSPLAGFTSHALDDAKAQGNVHIAFDLDLPIEHLEATTVRGKVDFQNNGLQLNTEAPQLEQLQGAVRFHDQGFELQRVRGQTLGGSFKIEGGMASPQQGVRIQARGFATAVGLQKDGNVPLLSQIAVHATGQSSYRVQVTANEGGQEVSVLSDLQGMALNLPTPFHKAAAEVLDLSVTQSLSSQSTQELRVEVAGRGWARYVQDASVTPAQVLRGQIVVGTITPSAVPEQGVAAFIQQHELNVDAWLDVLKSSDTGTSTALGQVHMWLPQHIDLNVGQLLVQDRQLEDVKAVLTQEGGLWHGSLDAKHFAGALEYRPPGGSDPSGRLFARLKHLSIPRAEAQRLNQAPAEAANAQVDTLPALDVEVDKLEIAGKSLGKLQLKASNSAGQFGRDWTLEQFDLTMPEAHWRAHGYWAATAPGAPRATHLGFLLEMKSSGQLLDRLGLPDVIRDGGGRLNGHVAWQGAPITPQWSSMNGDIHMQVEKGQFLKVEPGMGKLLSVLSLQSLTRRIALDFRDVFSQGFAFDYVRGDIGIEQGVARTNNLQMKGLNAAVLMEGTANLDAETQNLTVVVVPEINAMTASLAATVINPVIGVGSFLAQMFLRGPLMEAATRTFHIQGTWADPVVEQVRNKEPPASAAGQGVQR